MHKILIVEDNPDNRELLCQTLEYDYELIIAMDGREALQKAKEAEPDLILLDLSMPVMTGWEATEKLKEDPRLRQIPVIALSSHAMVGDEARARTAGCDDYVSKPISPSGLLDKIEVWLDATPS
jgi:CheY-like chemotaxis protein